MAFADDRCKGYKELYDAAVNIYLNMADREELTDQHGTGKEWNEVKLIRKAIEKASGQRIGKACKEWWDRWPGHGK